jgi:hypothetical protein
MTGGYGLVVPLIDEQEVVDEQVAESVDEQLGSPGLTLEVGVVLGLVLGLVLLIAIGHRRKRSLKEPVHSDTE